jgi:hypothetical protein
MLLKICLVVAILAGLGAGVVSHVKVAEKIRTTEAERDQNAEQRDQAKREEASAKAQAKVAKEAQEKAVQELTEATTALETITAKANEQQKRADTLEANLNKTTLERNEARQDLAAWEALGIPVDQIKTRLAEIKEVRDQRDAIAAENQTFLRKIKKLESDLSRYIGVREIEVEMQSGLSGKVVAVDPKWEFVVLDIGEKQGVLERGKFMVNRGGKLVAKVQVVRVEPDRCIANILPEWKQADVMEGDSVLH